MADTRGTILIVDDDPAATELLSDYLGAKRLAVARARNLDEALSELERERPDAGLISLRLGEGDRLEVLQGILEVNVQVGLLGMAEQEDAGRAKEALALEVFRATRSLSPEARGSVGTGLEQAALLAMQRGVGGEKAEVIRALNTAGRLDEHMVRACRSVGLS